MNQTATLPADVHGGHPMPEQASIPSQIQEALDKATAYRQAAQHAAVAEDQAHRQAAETRRALDDLHRQAEALEAQMKAARDQLGKQQATAFAMQTQKESHGETADGWQRMADGEAARLGIALPPVNGTGPQQQLPTGPLTGDQIRQHAGPQEHRHALPEGDVDTTRADMQAPAQPGGDQPESTGGFQGGDADA